ncbi:hypothetical protein IQ06DRAFT_347933 [Phaeosphaeriaceae sp. SRC1lsM3a]|nr:hypothetical protein IQ06DRAFT_347933 [Stagonospora sp. SRC1lsM3a]
MPPANIPPNKFFQSAVLDPSLPQDQTRSSAFSSIPATVVPTNMLKIIVGPDPVSQRTWTLPKALISKHSSCLALKCSSTTVELPSVTPHAFANFVDFMHSSIYSVNSQVPDYRPIRADTDACALGLRLGAKEYVVAAMRHLYELFEPLALLLTGSRQASMITAQDISYLCSALQGFSVPAYGLRIMFFDTVASHWTQSEVQHIGEAEGWKFLYTTNKEFQLRIGSSSPIRDSMRGSLLMPVQNYLKLVM